MRNEQRGIPFEGSYNIRKKESLRYANFIHGFMNKESIRLIIW